MATGKFVSYCRVSTARQGQSGLGLDAQKKAIADFLNGGDWELMGEYIEIESGKKNDRKELTRALHRCAMTGSTLLIAKLDRLSRDLHFISSLQKAGVEFTACDMPSASKFTIHILASVAEHEREMISQRTRLALQAAKARGQVLGSPNNLNGDAAAKGRKCGNAANKAKAESFAIKISPVIEEFQTQGLSLRQITAELNNRNILTASGQLGCWCPASVRNVILRIEKLLPVSAAA